MIKSGKNPQQLLMGILQNQAQQNPMYKDFLYLIQLYCLLHYCSFSA